MTSDLRFPQTPSVREVSTPLSDRVILRLQYIRSGSRDVMSRPADYTASATSFRRLLRASNRSTRTVETYGEAVDQLGHWLDDTDGVPDETGELARSHIEDFVVHLAEEGRAAATSTGGRAVAVNVGRPQRLGTRDDAASPRPARPDRLHPSAPAPSPGRALGRIRLELRPGALGHPCHAPVLGRAGRLSGKPVPWVRRPRRYHGHRRARASRGAEGLTLLAGYVGANVDHGAASTIASDHGQPSATAGTCVHSPSAERADTALLRSRQALRIHASRQYGWVDHRPIPRRGGPSRPPYNPTSSYLMTANGQAACNHSATVVRSTASSSARSARTHERTCASWAPSSSG